MVGMRPLESAGTRAAPHAPTAATTGGGNIPDRMRVGMAGNAWNAQLGPHSHFSIFQARAVVEASIKKFEWFIKYFSLLFS